MERNILGDMLLICMLLTLYLYIVHCSFLGLSCNSSYKSLYSFNLVNIIYWNAPLLFQLQVLMCVNFHTSIFYTLTDKRARDVPLLPLSCS